jgi:hypothetical protein
LQATEEKSPGSKLARAEFISYSKAVQLSYLCEASSPSAKGRGWSVVRVSCSVEKAEWAEQKRLYLNRNQKFQKQRTSGHCESGARLITSPNSFSTTNTLRNNSGMQFFEGPHSTNFFGLCGTDGHDCTFTQVSIQFLALRNATVAAASSDGNQNALTKMLH